MQGTIARQAQLFMQEMTTVANICHLEKCQPGPHPGQPEAFACKAQGLPQGIGDKISQLRASRRFGLNRDSGGGKGRRRREQAPAQPAEGLWSL